MLDEKHSSVMAYNSVWSTPEVTPPHIQVVEISTPPSGDVSYLYQELITTALLKKAPKPACRYVSRSNACHRMRLRNRIALLTVSIIVFLGWWLNSSKRMIQSIHDIDLSTHNQLGGLQFIDANHPYIRVRNTFYLNASSG